MWHRPEAPGQVAVCLLWLEKPAEGTAPGFHLDGTLERLRIVRPDAQVTVVARVGGPLLLDHLRTFLRFTVEVGRHDVVICRWHAATLPSLLLARAQRRRVVLLVQGTVDDMRQAHGLLRILPVTALARWCFRLADAIAVPYEGIGRWVGSVAGTGPEPVLLPNRIPAYDRDQEDAAPPPVEPPYVIFVGSLSPWQGLGILLEALDSESWPQGVSLAVVGDGPERWRVQGREQDGVTWLGHLPPRRHGRC